MKKLKILELTNYSAGICGVWQRVKQEALELSKKGHEVRIFSSNAIKGSTKLAPPNDLFNNISIKRFKFKKLGGESFMYWNFEKQVIKFSPDVIIAHSYRHPHTTKALKIKKILKSQGRKCKVFLVTHAPFLKDNSTRSFIQGLFVNFYDKFIGRKIINKFDKIITITQWENSFLEKLGVDKEKITYLPNGIPEEFFKIKPKKGLNIFFLGRISPIKNLETLIKSINKTKFLLDIIGPAEKNYKLKLLGLIKNLKSNNVKFKPAVFDINNKIKIIDGYEIFVLPSKREGLPQSLIEAMARNKIVISSENYGGKELIQDNKNGFLFKINDFNQLSQILNNLRKMSENQKSKIRQNARKTAQSFKWNNLINKLERLF
tara:strand:+ start:3869 stop:4993 length:1125 start_codon:yes stop_codon:yes gene_type:complete